MPKVSIIVPIHNPGKYLEPLLESLIHQTFEDLEILLIDDGSTDESRDIIKTYADQNNKIKIYFREKANYEHFGQKYSVDLGLQEATGNYIMIIDHDDELSFDAVEILYSYTQNGVIDIVQGRNISMNEQNECVYITENLYPTPTLIIPKLLTKGEYLKYLVRSPVALWACLIKKDIFNQVELGDYIFNDTDFIWKIKLTATTFYFIPEYIYKQNMHDDSTSSLGYSIKAHGLDILQSARNLERFLKERNWEHWDLFCFYIYGKVASRLFNPLYKEEELKIYLRKYLIDFVEANVDISYIFANDEDREDYEQFKKLRGTYENFYNRN